MCAHALTCSLTPEQKTTQWSGLGSLGVAGFLAYTAMIHSKIASPMSWVWVIYYTIAGLTLLGQSPLAAAARNVLQDVGKRIPDVAEVSQHPVVLHPEGKSRVAAGSSNMPRAGDDADINRNAEGIKTS